MWNHLAPRSIGSVVHCSAGALSDDQIQSVACTPQVASSSVLGPLQPPRFRDLGRFESNRYCKWARGSLGHVTAPSHRDLSVDVLFEANPRSQGASAPRACAGAKNQRQTHTLDNKAELIGNIFITSFGVCDLLDLPSYGLTPSSEFHEAPRAYIT